MATPDPNQEHYPANADASPVSSFPPLYPSAPAYPPQPGVTPEMAPTGQPSASPYMGSTPSLPVAGTEAQPTLSMISGAVPPSGYWLPPGHPLPPGYILPPGYAFPPGYPMPLMTSPDMPVTSAFSGISGAPSIPLSPPETTKRRGRGRLIALIVIPLVLLLAAGSTLVILGTNGIGPLASTINRPFPTYLHWSGQTSPSGIALQFTVDPGRAKVNEMDVTYNGFRCSDASGQYITITNRQGPDRVFPTGTWPISDGNFSTSETLRFGDSSGNDITAVLTINGKFASDGNSLGGTWQFATFVTCSGTWSATGT